MHEDQVSKSDSRVTLASIRRERHDFKIVEDGDLGEGSYGKVVLVQERATGREYAMKIIPKDLLLKYSTTENMKSEVKIQSGLRHPHILKLLYYFEDDTNVYMILEYAHNGNLILYNLRFPLSIPKKETEGRRAP